MSIEQYADQHYAFARQQWQEADQAARLAYIERVQALQHQYEDDVRPFRDVYNSAERAAWLEYQAQGRLNWNAYKTMLNMVAVPDTPATITNPPTEGNPE
jgi:hypothetical protein